jgi:DNA polymerase III alpha subunit
MHIGRGSGANSIISYCLGITNICPLELDLYFERFLNLNRKVHPILILTGVGRAGYHSRIYF